MQPVHKRHIVTITAQERHRRVRMRVDKTRDGKVVCAVNDFACMEVIGDVTDSHNAVFIDEDVRDRRRATW